MQESSQKLYDAMIEAVGGISSASRKQRAMLTRIRADYYHEWVGPLAMPVLQLVADLQNVKLGALAQRAKAGEFDATDAEAKAWSESPEGQATFREFLGPLAV